MKRIGDALPAIGVKPLVWMRQLRGSEAGPSARAVLWALALRLKSDGTGFASQPQLAADTALSERTVRRALDWAMGCGWLQRTRRGHRAWDGTRLASTYRLVIPTGNTDRLGGGSQPAKSEAEPANRDAQPATGGRPGGLSSGGLSSGGAPGDRPLVAAAAGAQHPAPGSDEQLEPVCDGRFHFTDASLDEPLGPCDCQDRAVGQ